MQWALRKGGDAEGTLGNERTLASQRTRQESRTRLPACPSSGTVWRGDGWALTFDAIIDTVPVAHDVTPYVGLLDVKGGLVIVGNLDAMEGFNALPLIMGRRRITGSPSAGIAQTQEMLDFCTPMQILPEIETISINEIGEAFERMERGDVRKGFVIDMASLQP